MRGTTTMSATSAPVGRSYASGTYPVALLGDTIGDNFDATASRFGDREALVDVAAGRRWGYRELGAGDRVGIWAPNCAEGTLTQYATAKSGAILVNINPAYGARELAYVLRQSGIRLVGGAPAPRSAHYAGVLEA